MKKFICALTVTMFLSGCASYNASPLNTLTTFVVQPHGNKPVETKDLTVIAKIFSKADCKKYLDRNVIKMGYQPIQLRQCESFQTQLTYAK